MKAATLAVVLSLFAVTEASTGAFLDPVARLGAVGVLSAALWYLLTKFIPKERDCFRAALEKMQEHDKDRERQRKTEALEITALMHKLCDRPCLAEKNEDTERR